jgi:putative ABC transport system ATP-binding protein
MIRADCLSADELGSKDCILEWSMNESSQTPTPLIALQHVSKTYRDGHVQALQEVSLDLFGGQFMTIAGPSGCGKSTLLHMLGALDRPTAGQVLFRGQALTDGVNLDRLRAREIGFVFQTFYLLPNLTAMENVQLPMFEGELPPLERAAEAKRLLAQVGLGDRLQHLPDQLSIGQRQRVAIARALANRPSIVLADEPTGSLDSQSGREVMEILVELNRQSQMTLVVVTHDESIAGRGTRQIRMLDGRIISDSNQVAGPN